MPLTDDTDVHTLGKFAHWISFGCEYLYPIFQLSSTNCTYDIITDYFWGPFFSHFNLILFFSSVDIDESGKVKYPHTGSITHGSELTFLEFLDLFKSFS